MYLCTLNENEWVSLVLSIQNTILMEEKHRWYRSEFAFLWPLLTQQQQILGLFQHTELQNASQSAELSSVWKAGIPLLFLSFISSFFISRVSKTSWQGQPGEQLPQRVPKGPSQPGWGRHQGLFQERWPPAAVCVAAWAKHTGPRLSCYSAKLILCRYTQTSSSCSSFFGLLYSRHFTGTSVSLGPSRRKKCCFGVLFFKITTLSYPRHTLLHEAGKEGRESPACTGRQWVWGTAPLAEGSGKRQVPGKLPASKTPARPQRKLWALITHPGHAKRVRVIPPET